MSTDETEWSLQKRLTTSWLARDLVLLNEEPLLLAAWEVMTSFRINDSPRHWSEPSIDFLFLDRSGRMVFLELKREVQAPRDAWSLICQVTHRAQVLGAEYSQSRLEAVYLDCHSGGDKRKPGSSSVQGLMQRHARAFGQPPLKDLPSRPVRRLVMAKAFSASFFRVLESANHQSTGQIKASLQRYRPSGEIKRFMELPDDLLFVDPAPIQAVTVDGLAARH